MNPMWHDLRDALRGFAHTPAFTLTAVAALGIAIGANATIFSLIDGLWLRPPGVRQPGDLVRIFQTTQTQQEGTWSFPEYEAIRDRTTSFAGVVAVGRRGAQLAAPDGSLELLLANVVSLDFFTVLGVTAAHGRLFSPADVAALDAEPAVVLGHAFWRRRFGGDPAIVGRRIALGRTASQAVLVLGVLPASFRDLDADSDRDLWLPTTTWARMDGTSELTNRSDRWFEVIARRRSGTSTGAARAEIESLAAALASEWPETNAGRGAALVPDLTHRLRSGGPAMLALLALVLIVVLITCVNIAHLLLSRATRRAREFALRAALGAGRRRLVEQLLVEAGLLGALGAGAGLLIAAWLVRVLPWLVPTPPTFQAFTVFQVDARVLAFTLAVTLITSVLFGVAPAMLAARTDVGLLVKGTIGLPGIRGFDHLVRRVLIVGQIAVSLALVYAATMLAQSLRAVERIDLGFSRAPLLTAWIPSGTTPAILLHDVLARVQQLPDVRRVALAIRAPLSFSGGGLAQPVHVPGSPAPPTEVPLEVKYGAISANYFAVMGTRIVRGRGFREDEARGGEPVVVINEAFADRFFGEEDPIGRSVRPGGAAAPDHLVVGVAANAVINRIDERPEPYFYVPYWRGTHGEVTLLVDAGNNPAAVAQATQSLLRQFDTRLEPRLMITMQQYLDFSAGLYRTTAALATSLGGIGLLLMTLGVYGVVTDQTARRTREIGIRIAVGAARGQVLRMVMGDSARLVAFGLAAGSLLALGLGQLIASLLFGMGPVHLPALVMASAILVAAVGIASFLPAWRATCINPSSALRET